MNIDGVENGIVIDHIQPGDSMRIYRLLELDELDCSVAIIQNVVSRKHGRKDIIKIDQDIDVDLDALGYIDPRITVNIVQNNELVAKKHLELPKRLWNIVDCKNPRCITSVEDEVDQLFELVDPERELYRCIYCEAAAEKQAL